MEESESNNQKNPSKDKGSEGTGLSDFIEREMLIQELRTSIMTMTTKVNLIDGSQREKK